MSRSTFKILFYLKRNAPKKNGLIPVMCQTGNFFENQKKTALLHTVFMGNGYFCRKYE